MLEVQLLPLKANPGGGEGYPRRPPLSKQTLTTTQLRLIPGAMQEANQRPRKPRQISACKVVGTTFRLSFRQLNFAAPPPAIATEYPKSHGSSCEAPCNAREGVASFKSIQKHSRGGESILMGNTSPSS